MAVSYQRHQTLEGYTPFFEHWGPAILDRIGNSNADVTLTASILKQSDQATTFHICIDLQHAILKLFDGASPNSQQHYEKERTCLASFKGRDGIARHMAHCDDAAFVMTHMDEGEPLDQATNAFNVRKMAFSLGKWLARFDAIAPSAPLNGTWGSYLARYDTFDRLDQYPALFEIPLLGRSLAMCDNALSNFLIDPDGNITRIDFETATMKPRGWDFIFIFESLARRYPDQVDDVLSALSDGYFQHHKGALLPDEMESLARIIFIERLSQLPSTGTTRTEAQLNGD